MLINTSLMENSQQMKNMLTMLWCKLKCQMTSKITIYSHPTKDFLESRSDISGSHFLASEAKTMAYNMAVMEKKPYLLLIFCSQVSLKWLVILLPLRVGNLTTWMKISPSLITTHRFLGPPLVLWVNWKSSIKHNFWINKLSKPVLKQLKIKKPNLKCLLYIW